MTEVVLAMTVKVLAMTEVNLVNVKEVSAKIIFFYKTFRFDLYRTEEEPLKRLKGYINARKINEVSFNGKLEKGNV